jgi:hypothetical protein
LPRPLVSSDVGAGLDLPEKRSSLNTWSSPRTGETRKACNQREHAVVAALARLMRDRWLDQRPASMAGAYSMGLRQRVVAAVEVWAFVHAQGLSFKKTRSGWRTRSLRPSLPSRKVDEAQLVLVDSSWRSMRRSHVLHKQIHRDKHCRDSRSTRVADPAPLMRASHASLHDNASCRLGRVGKVCLGQSR